MLARDEGSATQCRMLEQEGEAHGLELCSKVSGELVLILHFKDILFRLQIANFWFLPHYIPDL